MNPRNEETEAAYQAFKHAYDGKCVFCDMPEKQPDQIQETTDTMMIVQNVFPYETWDNFMVADHKMVVPKRHDGSFDDFTTAERDDFFELIRRYEAAHYSVYSRAPTNVSRTVAHLHTHLIKPVGF